MSPETRRAALLAAASTLVTTLACSSPPTPNDPATPATDPPLSERACAKHLASLAMAHPDELPDGDPLKTNDGSIYGAFTDVAARSDPKTQRCCEASLTRGGPHSDHRWACCSALPGLPAVRMACTPWGPPCPPALV
jgi:hypothetical protein